VKLSAQADRDGYRVEVFDRLDSTNDEAMSRARKGDPGTLWIVARQQDRGRGRHGRTWSSPPGNLYASLLLIDAARPAVAPQLGFVAGVALSRALRRVVPAEAPILLKWPNDAVCHDAKLSGLLVEGSQLAMGRFACVIGFGVNCRSHPDDLARKAANLSAVAGRPITACEVFSALSDEMPKALAVWRGGENFSAIRESWLTYAGGVGQKVVAMTGSRIVEGVFRTIDAGGRLVLETSSGPVAIEAADVFLREMRPEAAKGTGL